MQIDYLDTPIGTLKITSIDDTIRQIAFINELHQNTNNEITRDFRLYFENPNHVFKSKFALNVTPFQHRVLGALLKINVGICKTYGELASELSTSARAIGQALRGNPLPILIPCHRIVAKNSAGGYFGKTSGEMINYKKWLLAHEARRNETEIN